MSEPMTEAEQAAAETLRTAIVLDDKPLSRSELASAARAVVAAVRPILAAEALEDMADVVERMTGSVFATGLIRGRAEQLRAALRTTTPEKEN
jgi:hypothetical protein